MLQQFVEMLEKESNCADGHLKGLLKTSDGENISADGVLRIWEFCLDIDGKTRLPSKHANSECARPLLDVLLRRYTACGARLRPFIGAANGTKVGFFVWAPSENARIVKLKALGDASIELPVPQEEFADIADWELVGNHTHTRWLWCLRSSAGTSTYSSGRSARTRR